jgi:hypothetical protein
MVHFTRAHQELSVADDASIMGSSVSYTGAGPRSNTSWRRDLCDSVRSNSCHGLEPLGDTVQSATGVRIGTTKSE